MVPNPPNTFLISCFCTYRLIMSLRQQGECHKGFQKQIIMVLYLWCCLGHSKCIKEFLGLTNIILFSCCYNIKPLNSLKFPLVRDIKTHKTISNVAKHQFQNLKIYNHTKKKNCHILNRNLTLIDNSVKSITEDILEWSFYMNSLDLSLAAQKIRKIQISRFLRSVLEQLVCQKIFRKHMIRLQFFFKTNTL